MIFCGFIFGTGYRNNDGFGKEVVGEVKKKIEIILVSQEMIPKLFKLLEILGNFNPSKLTLSNRSKISIRSSESSDKEIHACETNPKRNTNKIHREYGSGSCYSYKAMSNPLCSMLTKCLRISRSERSPKPKFTQCALHAHQA
ncbi:hypothetical protein GmHk_09G025693 [Glycine max]|nr:hypothetical protein GmHk_09G025693 [Glycine max]